MTNGKPPFDSDPDQERTVIRPNPGGRRDDLQSPRPTPAPPSAARPGSENLWGGPQQNAAPKPQQASPSAPLPPAAGNVNYAAINAAASTGGTNPILECAMPLLILLSNVRIARAMPQVAPLMGTVAQGIETFEAALHGRNIPEAQVKTAKYALCATADDIVQNLPSTDRLLWTQHSMLSRYFQVRDSGVGFFEELNKLRQNPQLNHNLLGLMLACMSLGFEGKYRTVDGDVGHQQIRRDIYQTLRAREARVTDDISPHWRGQAIAAAYVRRAVPLWVLASCAAGLLFASFVVLRWLLGNMSDIEEAKLANLHPSTDINIQRVAFKPFEPPVIPQSTQLERIRAKLAMDISAKKLSADYAGKDIVVRLLNDAVFDTASANVRDGFLPSIDHVAAALDKEAGPIRIVGHTDNAALVSNLKFKDNQDLSEKRAGAVAKLLLPSLTDPTRVTTSGMADKAPIDPTNTPAARAKNRRVELFIQREDKQ